MRRFALSAMIGFTTLALIPPAAADEAQIVLSRSAPWQLDYDANACHLIGPFGRGEGAITLRFSKYDMVNSFTLAIIGKPLEGMSPRFSGTLDFGVSNGPVEAVFMTGKLGVVPAIQTNAWFGLRSATLPPTASPQMLMQEWETSRRTIAAFDGNRNVHSLKFTSPGKAPLHLEMGPMDKPMVQLDTCLDDLVRSWGYDPAIMRSLSRPVEPASYPGAWLSPKDYPTGALRKGQRAAVQFRLDVDSTGKATGCHVLQNGNADEFERKVCSKMLKRAAFRPALDKAGNPVRAYWKSAATFEIPLD